MSGEDIDAINAAMRLGDQAIPPDGVIIRTWGPTTKRWIIGVVRHSGTDFFPEAHWDSRSVTWVIPGTSRFEVVSLPDGCPPFERWERWGMAGTAVRWKGVPE